MSRLLVVAGPPGAGKTTVSTLVSARLSPSVLLRGDAFFRFLDQGAPAPGGGGAEPHGGPGLRRCGGTVRRGWVRGGLRRVLGPWFLTDFHTATGLVELHHLVLLPSADRCVDNVTAREGHDRGEPGTRFVHGQFVRSDLDDRHLVDPVGSPEEVAADVLSRYL